jgi:hypothetical protein
VKSPRIGYLAPELQSASVTFADEELAALEETGSAVTPFSLRRRPAASGTRRFGPDWVYGDAARVAIGFLHMFERHPLRTLAVLALAAKHTATGDFRSAGERWANPMHAIAGLSLSPRLEECEAVHLHVYCAHTAATVGMYAARGAKIGFSIASYENQDRLAASLLCAKKKRARTFIASLEERRHFLCEGLDEIMQSPAYPHALVAAADGLRRGISFAANRLATQRLGHGTAA